MRHKLEIKGSQPLKNEKNPASVAYIATMVFGTIGVLCFIAPPVLLFSLYFLVPTSIVLSLITSPLTLPLAIGGMLLLGAASVSFAGYLFSNFVSNNASPHSEAGPIARTVKEGPSNDLDMAARKLELAQAPVATLVERPNSSTRSSRFFESASHPRHNATTSNPETGHTPILK